MNLQDLRHRSGGTGEGRKPGRVVLARADRDERDCRQAERGAIDQSNPATDQPRRLERAKPAMAGRGREIETTRDLVHRQVSLLLQQGKDAQRGAVDLHRGTIIPINKLF